jgi:hypothetical protein
MKDALPSFTNEATTGTAVTDWRNLPGAVSFFASRVFFVLGGFFFWLAVFFFQRGYH